MKSVCQNLKKSDINISIIFEIYFKHCKQIWSISQTYILDCRFEYLLIIKNFYQIFHILYFSPLIRKLYFCSMFKYQLNSDKWSSFTALKFVWLDTGIVYLKQHFSSTVWKMIMATVSLLSYDVFQVFDTFDERHYRKTIIQTVKIVRCILWGNERDSEAGLFRSWSWH